MINILIVGHGFVGQAVDYGFSHPHVTKTIVDPKYGTNLDSTDVSLFDIAFVCVPTPMGNDGAVDSSIIDDVLNELVSSNITIVVKSTVTPDIDWSGIYRCQTRRQWQGFHHARCQRIHPLRGPDPAIQSES